jgi:hypothetical protein
MDNYDWGIWVDNIQVRRRYQIATEIRRGSTGGLPQDSEEVPGLLLFHDLHKG